MTPHSQDNYSKSQSLQRFLPFIPYFIIIVGLAFIIYSVLHPPSDFFTSVSAISAFFTTVLTSLYVGVNSKQLDVMQKQLNEMKNDRELQNQPLPWVYDVSAYVEKPTFYYTPPTKNFSAQSRYLVEFSIKNIGSYPAVCTDVSSYITIPDKEKNRTNIRCLLNDEENNSPNVVTPDTEKPIELGATSVRIDTLEDKETYPKNKEQKSHFLYSGDEKGVLLKRLIDGNAFDYPILRIRVVYKNVLGACFKFHNTYLLYPTYNNNYELDPILKNWMSQIVLFPINYSNELGMLRAFVEKSQDDKRIELVNQVKEQFGSSLMNVNSDDPNLNPNDPYKNLDKLRVIPIPGHFTIKPISNEEYMEATKDISYGFVPF